jgi:hypothetical protein
MADETIRFFNVSPDSGLLAMAEVTLFPGVYLRGWHVLQRGNELEVLPPHQIYQNPETGQEDIFELLRFQDEQTRMVWLKRVKDEYLKWKRKPETLT